MKELKLVFSLIYSLVKYPQDWVNMSEDDGIDLKNNITSIIIRRRSTCYPFIFLSWRGRPLGNSLKVKYRYWAFLFLFVKRVQRNIVRKKEEVEIQKCLDNCLDAAIKGIGNNRFVEKI